MTINGFRATADDVPDSEWLSDVFAHHREGLVRFVVGVLDDRAVAEDIVQTTFAKAVESQGHIDADAIKSWLYRVAFHEAIDRKRRLQVDREARRSIGESTGGESEQPDERLARAEQIDAIREALQKLSPDEQQVVRLRIYEQQTFAEIAQGTGWPLGTVLTRMRRALDKLRQTLRRQE